MMAAISGVVSGPTFASRRRNAAAEAAARVSWSKFLDTVSPTLVRVMAHLASILCLALAASASFFAAHTAATTSGVAPMEPLSQEACRSSSRGDARSPSPLSSALTTSEQALSCGSSLAADGDAASGRSTASSSSGVAVVGAHSRSESAKSASFLAAPRTASSMSKSSSLFSGHRPADNRAQPWEGCPRAPLLRAAADLSFRRRLLDKPLMAIWTGAMLSPRIAGWQHWPAPRECGEGGWVQVTRPRGGRGHGT
mmetsp:Transcript_110492/g.297649  ORF Transcript_110492/g.297649 Transcript_110492/m.297649 type:complete len:254 (+) Transcript_110492:460-1221(+)